MNRPLQNKVALITGGARGIGKATALKLAAAGCSIAINYFNSHDEAQALCAEIDKLGVDTCLLQGNVASTESINDMMQAFQARFDRLDIVVSNAASGVLKPALEMNTKHWRWCLETNALALVLLAQHAKPLMSKGGRIIALSSLGSVRAIPQYAFIGASKAALESLVRSLSIELAPDVSVNCISAGVVDTDALRYFPNRDTLLAEFTKRSLAGRELTTSDVANAVYLLCLPEADMIRGQTLYVDAGYSIIG